MIVLDTNVVSEAMRPRPGPAVITWLNDQAADTLFLSSVSLAELLFGIGALPEGKRRERLSTALNQLMTLFSGRVLPFDTDSARHYAQMAVASQRLGRPLAVADGYIAATASAHGYSVATRNVSDFESTGVNLIDPWAEQT